VGECDKVPINDQIDKFVFLRVRKEKNQIRVPENPGSIGYIY